jgi:predicted alpha/beta-fold hydrolase
MRIRLSSARTPVLTSVVERMVAIVWFMVKLRGIREAGEIHATGTSLGRNMVVGDQRGIKTVDHRASPA